jgi:hypothetical protein
MACLGSSRNPSQTASAKHPTDMMSQPRECGKALSLAAAEDGRDTSAVWSYLFMKLPAPVDTRPLAVL